MMRQRRLLRTIALGMIVVLFALVYSIMTSWSMQRRVSLNLHFKFFFQMSSPNLRNDNRTSYVPTFNPFEHK